MGCLKEDPCKSSGAATPRQEEPPSTLLHLAPPATARVGPAWPQSPGGQGLGTVSLFYSRGAEVLSESADSEKHYILTSTNVQLQFSISSTVSTGDTPQRHQRHLRQSPTDTTVSHRVTGVHTHQDVGDSSQQR